MTCTKDCSKPYDKVDGPARKIERLPAGLDRKPFRGYSGRVGGVLSGAGGRNRTDTCIKQTGF